MTTRNYADLNFITTNNPVTFTLTNNEATPLVSVLHKQDLTVQYTVSGIGTNVILRFEASLDGTNWFTLLADQTITANGSYAQAFSGRALKCIRVSRVSITGGTPSVVVRVAGAS